MTYLIISVNNIVFKCGGTVSINITVRMVLTDVVLSADFLQDVNLLHCCRSDLLDLLRGRFVRGGDVNNFHCIFLRRLFVDAAAHHTADSPEDETDTYLPSHLQRSTFLWPNFCPHPSH